MANSFVDLYPQYDLKKTDNCVPVNPFVENCLKSLRNPKNLNNDLIGIQNGVDVFIKSLNSAEKKLLNNPLQMFFTGLMNIFPAARRLAPIEDNEKTNNTFKAVGLGLLAVINLKEDLRDLLSIFGLSKSNAPKGYYAKFKFFNGTPVESLLKQTEKGKDLFDNWDTTLADTRIGEKIYSYLNLEEDIQHCEKETKFPFIKKEIILREYIGMKGSFIRKLIWLSTNRITKLGLVFMSLLELPAICNSLKEKKYCYQIPKSTLNVISCTFTGALFSALFSLAGIPSGSVIGLGVGLLIGNKLSKALY